MMKNNRFILIMIFTTIVVLAWIGFGFYHTIVSSTLTPDIADKMQRIPPKFNVRALEVILSRRQVPPTYESGSSQSSQSAEEATPTPTPTPTLILEEEQVVSEGAELL